jgi:hypothetical protein
MKTGQIDVLDKSFPPSLPNMCKTEISFKFYVTYTIFNYNTISLRCSFFPVPVKGLYQTASYNLHVRRAKKGHMNL